MKISAPTQVVIIHGTMGSSEGNWFPWLRGELAKLGISALSPQFPTPEGQTLNNWLDLFSQTVGQLSPSQVLVGHSVGATFVLRLLEQATCNVQGAYLVAGFARELGNPEFDPLLRTFVNQPFNWDKIRSAAKTIAVYAGDNDPYVPLELGSEVATNLGVELNVVSQGGHLNAESGYFEFPKLLADLKLLILQR